MKELIHISLLPAIQSWLEEDDLARNVHYTRTLPDHPVVMNLKVKSDLILGGTDYFIATFMALGVNPERLAFIKEYEGKKMKAGEVINFPESVPYSVALTGERLALNLVQHASSIATWTEAHVKIAKPHGIQILDTRKTTPGLRALEKYAVRLGGGLNHRFGQSDVWMIKDNHKACMGGLKGAYEFFKSQGTFYNNLIAEIHDLNELNEAITLGIQHVMLDNFSTSDISEAVKFKKPGMTFEVSGGIRLDTISKYMIPGVDALSIGALTYSAPRVDLSLKYRPA